MLAHHNVFQQAISSHCGECCDHSAYLHVDLASHLLPLVLLPRLGFSAQLLLEHHHLAVGVEEALLGFPLQQKTVDVEGSPLQSHLCSFRLENESLAGECVNPANSCFGQFFNLSLPLYFSPQHVEVVLHAEVDCQLQHLLQQPPPFISCLNQSINL